MTRLNFSWLIEGEVAGHEGPGSDQDLLWLKKAGVIALVRMAEGYQARVSTTQIQRLGLEDCHVPITDGTPPSQAQIQKLVAFITNAVSEAKPVGVSCYAGLGRTGTILACYLVSNGLGAQAAIKEVRAKRPGSIETPEQEKAVAEYADNRDNPEK